MNLVKEEPLPADAPPLPEKNQSEDSAGETDRGEGFIVSLAKVLFCGNNELYHYCAVFSVFKVINCEMLVWKLNSFQNSLVWDGCGLWSNGEMDHSEECTRVRRAGFA